MTILSKEGHNKRYQPYETRKRKTSTNGNTNAIRNSARSHLCRRTAGENDIRNNSNHTIDSSHTMSYISI